MKAFKEKVANTFRSGTKTEDSKFKEVHAEYEKTKKSLEKLDKRVVGFTAAAQELLVQQKKLAEELMKQVDESHPQSHVLKEHVKLIENMIAEKTRIDDELRRTFQDPINKYKQQYREMDERIRERARRCDEMDKLYDSVKKYTEKKDPRLQGTERRHQSMKQAYEELNNELIEEIPKLIHDKAVFLEPLTATLIDIELKFYQSMTSKILELQSSLAHIDRSRVQNHPKVILPREKSSIGKSYSLFSPEPSYNQNYSQPYNQGGYGQQMYSQPYGQPTYNQPQTYGQPTYNQPQTYGQPTYNQPLPTPPPRTNTVRARAMWDFVTNEPNELPFKKDDILNILSQQGNWWNAELNGRVGLIPSNYVQLI